MTRSTFILICLGLLAAVAAPSGASAGNYTYGFDTDRGNLGWAIVSDGNVSMSDMTDLDRLEDLKNEFGEEFLYIRLGEDRYAIRDREMIQRAKDAARPMQVAGREIGETARAQAEQALGGSQSAREQAKLSRRIAKLSGRIARRESRGESARDLEREMAQLDRQLEALTEDSRDRETVRREKHELHARSREASARLREAGRHLNEEMRDILRDAKARRLAQPVR
jgi:hypothetical protein